VSALAASQQAADDAAQLSQLCDKLTHLDRVLGTPIPTIPPEPTEDLSIDQLQQLISQVEDLDNKIEQSHNLIKVKKKKLEKQLGGRCPVCGGFLTNGSLI
jgi:hypothetical protein